MLFRSRDELDSISKAKLEVNDDSDGSKVVKMHGSFWLVCEKDDDAFTPPVMRTGNWEAWNTVAIMRELGTLPGPTFVDVGANVGYFAMTAWTEGYETIAFEPNPDVVDLLMRSAYMNAEMTDAGIKIVPKGVGDKPGTLFLHDFDGHSGANSFVYGPDTGTEVEIVTLDDSIDQKKRVFILKVDVEGFEREVWDGAKELRAESHNVWFLEWVPVRHGYDYNKEWLEEVLLTHDLQMVNYDGSLRAVGLEEALVVDFEMIVFRKRDN